MKMRSIIVDDELIARNVLENYLKKYCPSVELVGQAQHIKEAVPMIRSLTPLTGAPLSSTAQVICW